MNTKPLKDYFLQERDGRKLFEQDINHDNPLGMQGKIAINFAKVVSQMWSGEYTVVSPVDLKRVIGEYAPQFAGYQQQDSQEVMNFLLDGLHEDLNRVKKKPYTTPVEHNGRDDETVAKEEWAQYLRRNDSIIVDNFMGQLRSHVICSNPNCANESITFDPFMSLSVPIPDEASLDIQVKLFWADGKIPTKYLIQVKQDAVIADVKDKLTSLSGVVQSMLFFVHVLNHRITSGYKDNTLVEDVRENTLHVYELDYPVDNYKFCSSMLRSSVQLSPTAAGFGNNKHMLLVALLHQAPCASPSDSRSDAEEYDFLEDEGVGNKQRRVELELFNTPLLVSLNSSYTKAEIHQKVWQVVQRLLSESAAASFGCGEGQSLPYRLHLTKPTGIGTLVPDFPNLDEPSELPDANETPFCFTLEWSRHG
jgi:ubiquitin carboxyl-terminal hydrolase 4/11/15